MAKNSNVKITISFNDPELVSDDLEKQALNLRDQLLKDDLGEIETIARVIDPNPSERSKAVGGALAGILTAEVSIANVKKLMVFLSGHLVNKPIELEVEANGKKLKVKASSQAELTAAIDAAQKFISE